MESDLKLLSIAPPIDEFVDRECRRRIVERRRQELQARILSGAKPVAEDLQMDGGFMTHAAKVVTTVHRIVHVKEAEVQTESKSPVPPPTTLDVDSSTSEERSSMRPISRQPIRLQILSPASSLSHFSDVYDVGSAVDASPEKAGSLAAISPLTTNYSTSPPWRFTSSLALGVNCNELSLDCGPGAEVGNSVRDMNAAEVSGQFFWDLSFDEFQRTNFFADTVIEFLGAKWRLVLEPPAVSDGIVSLISQYTLLLMLAQRNLDAPRCFIAEAALHSPRAPVIARAPQHLAFVPGNGCTALQQRQMVATYTFEEIVQSLEGPLGDTLFFSVTLTTLPSDAWQLGLEC